MYESSSCEPCAYEDGTQVHQLDGITGKKKKTIKKTLVGRQTEMTKQLRFLSLWKQQQDFDWVTHNNLYSQES